MTQRNLDDDFLCHYGILGQEWGKRRYQNPDGSLTDEGRAHWGIGPARKKRKSFRLETPSETRERLELKKQKKVEKNAYRLQKQKNKMIATGNIDAIYKNRSKFTDEELASAIKRIQAIQNLEKMSPKQQETVKKLQKTQNDRQNTKNGKDFVDKIHGGAKTAVAIAGTAISLYQAYNKIAGAVNELSGEDKLPTFDMNPWSKKDTDKKQNKSDDQKKNSYDLETSGQQSSTTAQIRRQDGWTTTKDQWSDIVFSPSAWSSSSAIGSNDGWSATNQKLKRSSQKKQSIFDVDNGYLSSSDLKAISKGKSEVAQSAATFLNMYSSQEKAKKISFDDLAAPTLWRGISKETTSSGTSVKLKRSDDSPYEIVQTSVSGEYGFGDSDYLTYLFRN